MEKGTALFDSVAISDISGSVRARRIRDASRAGRAVGAGFGGRGARADCNRRGCAGCAQDDGGVVRMDDGAITFKGGSISNTKAVRSPRELRAPHHDTVCCAVRHGR
jgi:hypothetical protein